MTKSIRDGVRSDVSEQMRIIRQMANEVQALYDQAERENNPALKKVAQDMSVQLRSLVERAYSVGERVLDKQAA